MGSLPLVTKDVPYLHPWTFIRFLVKVLFTWL